MWRSYNRTYYLIWYYNIMGRYKRILCLCIRVNAFLLLLHFLFFFHFQLPLSLAETASLPLLSLC